MTVKISNLPANVTHCELKDFFVKYGFPIKEIKSMEKRISDKCESTEYVFLKDHMSEETAVKALNGKEWRGQVLSVTLDTKYTDLARGQWESQPQPPPKPKSQPKSDSDSQND